MQQALFDEGGIRLLECLPLLLQYVVPLVGRGVAIAGVEFLELVELRLDFRQEIGTRGNIFEAFVRGWHCWLYRLRTRRAKESGLEHRSPLPSFVVVSQTAPCGCQSDDRRRFIQ
jgi:hypothetical protein